MVQKFCLCEDISDIQCQSCTVCQSRTVFVCVDERTWPYERLKLAQSGSLREHPQLAALVCRTPSASAPAKSSRHYGEYA